MKGTKGKKETKEAKGTNGGKRGEGDEGEDGDEEDEGANVMRGRGGQRRRAWDKRDEGTRWAKGTFLKR